MRRPHGGVVDPGVLDFSANVNPLEPPDVVRAVLARGMELISRYGSADARDFCKAVARHHGIPAECVLAGNGASDLVYLLARTLVGERVGVVIPAFTEYEDACEAFGTQLVEKEATVTFLANPTSPEGQLLSRREILDHPGRIVVDEAFMDFVEDTESLVTEAVTNPRLIVLRTLTKFYAIPGLRLGYLVAVPETVARLKRAQAPWSVNALAEAVGIEVLKDREYAVFVQQFVRQRREELTRELRTCGLEPLPSVANFILCRVPDATIFCRELAERGIVVRNCDSFTGLERNRYVRFAVRKRSENERLLWAIREVLELCPARR